VIDDDDGDDECWARSLTAVNSDAVSTTWIGLDMTSLYFCQSINFSLFCFLSVHLRTLLPYLVNKDRHARRYAGQRRRVINSGDMAYVTGRIYKETEHVA